MIAGVLVDDVPRCSVLAFASVHVLGLLTHHPAPWSATLAAASLLVVAMAATVRAQTGTLRSLALLSGLTAVAGLVAQVEYRGGGLGWPFFLTEAPDGGAARIEAALVAVAVLGLSAAALLPEHGTEERLLALRLRLHARLRAWYAERRTRVLDLLEPPPDPATGGPVVLEPHAPGGPGVLDLGVLEPHAPGVLDLGVLGPHAPRPDRPRRDPDRWRARLAVTGTVAVTALVAAVATAPMWLADRYGQLPILESRDLAGLLLATAPLLGAVVAGTVAACRSVRRARMGTALAAVVFVALAAPVVGLRGGEYRFSPEPPPAQGAHGLYFATLSMTGYCPAAEPTWLPPPLVHPAPPIELPAQAATSSPDGAGGPFDRDEVGDGVLAGLALVAFLALTTALLPAPARPELLR
jgi:hypothetical protein